MELETDSITLSADTADEDRAPMPEPSSASTGSSGDDVTQKAVTVSLRAEKFNGPLPMRRPSGMFLWPGG